MKTENLLSTFSPFPDNRGTHSTRFQPTPPSPLQKKKKTGKQTHNTNNKMTHTKKMNKQRLGKNMLYLQSRVCRRYYSWVLACEKTQPFASTVHPSLGCLDECTCALASRGRLCQQPSTCYEEKGVEYKWNVWGRRYIKKKKNWFFSSFIFFYVFFLTRMWVRDSNSCGIVTWLFFHH